MNEAMPPKYTTAGTILGFGTLQLGTPLSRVISTNLLDLGQWHGLFLLEVSLALACLAAILAVRLTPMPRQQCFDRWDLLAFPPYAVGLALLAVVLSQGRTAWWTDSAWIGLTLATSVACLGLYAVIELARSRPLLDLRWLASAYMIRFLVAVILFRVVLSEQSIGVVGLMSIVGQNNEQMRVLFALATAAMSLGFGLSIFYLVRRWEHFIVPTAVALVAFAAFIDAGSTSLSRPENFYLTQSLLSVALAMYFAGACILGFGPVVVDGGRHLITFLAAFSAVQYLGSLAGSAWLTTLVARRETVHFAQLAEQMTLSNPLEADRVNQLAAASITGTFDPLGRAGRGVGALVQQVTQQANVLAYDDLFTAIGALSALMMVWLSFLAWRAARRNRALVSVTA